MKILDFRSLVRAVPVLFLALPLQVHAVAVTQPDLIDVDNIFAGSSLDRVRSFSGFDCGSLMGFSSSCTFTYQLTYESVDPTFVNPFEVTWAGANLTATLSAARPNATWTSSVVNNLSTQNPTSPSQSLSFRNINGLPNGGAAADQYSHPSQTTPVQEKSLFDLLNDLGDSLFGRNTLEENPVLAEFNSQVELIGPGQYEYVYEVINVTDSPVMFDWFDVSILGGVVAPNDTMSWSFISTDAPVESYGSIISTVRGDDFVGPSATIVPTRQIATIAEPWGVILLGVGALLLLRRIST